MVNKEISRKKKGIVVFLVNRASWDFLWSQFSTFSSSQLFIVRDVKATVEVDNKIHHFQYFHWNHFKCHFTYELYDSQHICIIGIWTVKYTPNKRKRAYAHDAKQSKRWPNFWCGSTIVDGNKRKIVAFEPFFVVDPTRNTNGHWRIWLGASRTNRILNTNVRIGVIVSLEIRDSFIDHG